MTAREHVGDSKPSRLKLNMTPLSGDSRAENM
jgi:hypothetical protein